jgi:hypothetical protein
VAINGTINPATQLIPNPFQPFSGALIPSSGALGQATLPRQVTVYPYPLLTANMSRSNGFPITARWSSLRSTGSLAA